MKRAIFELLHEHGWTEIRKVDISELLEWYHKNNYFPTEEQISFLENFVDIEIPSLDVYFVPMDSFIIEKDMAGAVELLKKLIQSYSKYAKDKLIPIGISSVPFVTLLMDRKLRIYAVEQYMIAFLGNNIFEVLEILYENNPEVVKWDVLEELTGYFFKN